MKFATKLLNLKVLEVVVFYSNLKAILLTNFIEILRIDVNEDLKSKTV